MLLICSIITSSTSGCTELSSSTSSSSLWSAFSSSSKVLVEDALSGEVAGVGAIDFSGLCSVLGKNFFF